jgi:excisionase family DNA binding protein
MGVEGIGRTAKTLADFPDPMKPSQVAKLWTMSSDTIVAMCESGELEAVRIRRSWRIYKTAVIAYLEGVKREARQND